MMGAALHFQDGSFLAHYAAMQHRPATTVSESSESMEKSVEKQRLPSGDITTKEVEKPVEIQVEIGGRGGPEPTRFGDWEKAGRCIDF